MVKRFIAGAYCPSCHAMDTLRWWRDGEQDKFDCVVCDCEISYAIEPNQDSTQVHQKMDGAEKCKGQSNHDHVRGDQIEVINLDPSLD